MVNVSRNNGYDLRSMSYPVVYHTCGKKVRLSADGWGYCRRCDDEFDGATMERVTVLAKEGA